MKKFVIDTDVGTDPDDLFALTYALRSEVPVEAISIVQGNVFTRGRIAKKLEKLLDAKVPIVVGGRGPNFERYWGGFEEEALTPEDSSILPLLLSEFDVTSYDKDTRLISIGPLTNILYQLYNSETIENVQDVYVMGSREDSHNFKVDPQATKRVFGEPWNIYQITKEDSLKVTFEASELEELRINPLGEFLYESAMRGMKHMGRTNLAMYDVLVVSAALDEGLVSFEQQADNRYVSNGVDSKELKRRIREKII